ncbi:hypothetical protein CYY_000848 [Polysphondylium violaceum]|uniref:Uncharacterized protein n=1 Tax=Polysphondylium violaceum TaxID=133409 RepID=A0A8J4Q154_9MYCE|nr:hypothetical protein CYY_000848 [Polysphondylium violaceum]
MELIEFGCLDSIELINCYLNHGFKLTENVFTSKYEILEFLYNNHYLHHLEFNQNYILRNPRDLRKIKFFYEKYPSYFKDFKPWKEGDFRISREPSICKFFFERGLFDKLTPDEYQFLFFSEEWEKDVYLHLCKQNPSFKENWKFSYREEHSFRSSYIREWTICEKFSSEHWSFLREFFYFI